MDRKGFLETVMMALPFMGWALKHTPDGGEVRVVPPPELPQSIGYIENNDAPAVTVTTTETYASTGTITWTYPDGGGQWSHTL